MGRRSKTDPAFSPPNVDCPFVGRSKEIGWLQRWIDEFEGVGKRPPFIVTGEPGIGKTTLVSEVAGHFGGLDKVIWINAHELNEHFSDVERAIRSTIDNGKVRRVIAIFDGADEIPEKELFRAWWQLTKYELVRDTILTCRTRPAFPKGPELKLERLKESDSELLILRQFSSDLLAGASMEKLLSVVHGHPMAVNLLADMARAMDPEQLRNVLMGRLYDLRDAGTDTQHKLVTVAKPIIISTNEAMVQALKKQPGDIFKLDPRQYEELIAELLIDMGYEVTLTKATRDGGKDILASLMTECGDILCLVEAKRYRQDRKIGISLVRALYGTLCDFKATSGMLVTTSSFSPDAHSFQKNHQYQLSLKDYTDVAGWIQRYGALKTKHHY